MRGLLLLAALAATASAQPTDWATLTPAVGAAVPLADGFGPPWTMGAGLSARVEAPAYGGRARAEVRVSEYDVTDEAAPGFTLVVPTLGWGPAFEVGRARLSAGGRVGAGLFGIDDDAAGNLQNETEVAVGAWAGGAVRVGRVEVWAEADVTRLTLSDPVTLVSAGGGLAVRLDTPRWLRGALR